MRTKIARIQRAISSGLEYLKRRQRGDGSFLDFSSTGRGGSIDWITTHLCWVLEDIPEFKPFQIKAVQALLSRMKKDGSWGFNEFVSGDAGTTAQVVMVLQRQGIKVNQNTIHWLLLHQQSNGGFSTYSHSEKVPFNHWSRPHLETTLYVHEALYRLRIAKQQRDLAKQWIEKYNKKGVLLNAFWWKNPAYLLWTQKKVKINCDYAVNMSQVLLNKGMSLGSPDLSLLLYKTEHYFYSDFIILQAIEHLLHLQRSDGSWSCQPCLRVPKRTGTIKNTGTNTDTNTDKEILYSGNQRIFSTAHAIATLFQVFSCLAVVLLLC